MVREQAHADGKQRSPEDQVIVDQQDGVAGQGDLAEMVECHLKGACPPEAAIAGQHLQPVPGQRGLCHRHRVIDASVVDKDQPVVVEVLLAQTVEKPLRDARAIVHRQDDVQHRHSGLRDNT